MKTGKPTRALTLVLASVLLLILSAPASRAEEDIQPLFPVTLKHELPDAKETFDKARELILKNYYTPAINEDALYWAAIQGMLRFISPPENPGLASLWTPEQYEKFVEALTGEQVSLGLKSSFNPGEGSLTVSEVLPDSPADTILRPLDRILRINGESLKGKDVRELNRLLEGEEGGEVTFTVNRDIKVFEVTLKRERFEDKDLVASLLTPGTAVVEIRKFSLNLSSDLKAMLAGLSEKGVKNLILDLRNNQGGVFTEALKAAELFLPEKQVILATLRRDNNPKTVVSGNPKPFEFSIAILVNHRTASSAEILATALRDNHLGFIVGTRTFGKGVFETTFKLDNDCRLKFITGAMYSPKGQSWQGRGVTPDFLVEQDDKTVAALLKIPVKDRFARDVALITAFKLLKRC